MERAFEGTAAPPARRSLVPHLALTLLLLLSLYLGTQVPAWTGTGFRWEEAGDRAEGIALWRRSQYDPRRDPPVGRLLPALQLPTPAGGFLPLCPE
jgi:hypothetical protein